MKQIRLLIKNWGIVSLLLIGLVSRLYLINTPLADWHSFRQVDTASVTREYIKHGIDILRPHYHDLSNIQSGMDNLDGYRMVEFPFINGLIALTVRVLPFLPLVPTSRFVSILFSLGAIASLYYLIKNLSSFKLAYLSALLMAIMPYSVFYSRTVLPEAPMLFFFLFSLLSFYLYLNRRKYQLGWLSLSIISLSLALLLKPFVAFLAPVYLALWLEKDGFSFYKRWPTLLFLLSFVPLLLWRKWILNFPSGIPASDWLFNGNGIRLRPAWFRWLFWERLTKLITGFGSIVMPLAFLSKWKRDTFVILSWWIGILVYLIVIATGNVQHDYYQVITIPIVCLTMAKGLVWVWNFIENKLSYSSAVVSVLLLISIFWGYSYNQVKGYYNINHWEYVQAGKAVDQLLPADAKVIAPAMGDTVFLFQTNRTGWPIGFEIEDKINLGAEYYVSTSYDDETNMLKERYQILEQTKDYIIIDLQKPVILE